MHSAQQTTNRIFDWRFLGAALSAPIFGSIGGFFLAFPFFAPLLPFIIALFFDQILIPIIIHAYAFVLIVITPFHLLMRRFLIFSWLIYTIFGAAISAAFIIFMHGEEFMTALGIRNSTAAIALFGAVFGGSTAGFFGFIANEHIVRIQRIKKNN